MNNLTAYKTKGGMLIIALWSLCLLAVFAAHLGYTVRQRLMLVNRLEEKSKLRFIAEAGARKAISITAAEEPKTYNALSDSWSSSDMFKDIRVGDGTASVCYEYIDEETGISRVQYGLVDEGRKININTASETQLERFFHMVLSGSCGETDAQELAASIIDWRDKDSELSIPLGSAESSYYRNLSCPYEAKDGEIEVLDEILLVKGMTSEIFAKIKDYITIYGSGRININTAPKVVLMALGLDKDIADKIISFRNGKDKIAGTSDDNVFDSPSNILPRLSQFCRMSDSEIAQLSRVAEEALATASDNFMIRSIARLNNKRNTAQTICVIDRKAKVLYWQES